MVALVFQLTDIVAAGLFKVGDVNIAVLIGFILSHGILIAVIEQEGYAIDALASGTVDFVDEDAGQRLVLDGQRGGFAALDLKVMGRIIQSERFVRCDLFCIVAAILQSHEHTAIFVRRNGIHQGIVHLADLKGRIRDALTVVILVDLDDLHATHRIVVKVERLRIVGIDHHGLGAGIFVDGVTVDGFFLRYHQCAGDALEDDLPVLIRVIQTVGADFSIFVGDKLAGSGGNFERNSRQRFLRHSVQLVDDERTLTLIPEGQALHRPCLDENILGCAVQHEAIHRFDLTGNYGSAGF